MSRIADHSLCPLAAIGRMTHVIVGRRPHASHFMRAASRMLSQIAPNAIPATGENTATHQTGGMNDVAIPREREKKRQYGKKRDHPKASENKEPGAQPIQSGLSKD